MILVHLLVFLLFNLFVTYPLGRVLLRLFRIEKPFFTEALLSVILGLWGFTIESLIIGLVGAQVILLPLLVFQLLICSRILVRSEKVVPNSRLIRIDYLILLIIVSSVLINGLITFPFGVATDKGILLGGAHSVDNNWHLSLINSIQKGIPPENPLFSGEVIKNYHYLVDLQIGYIQGLTKIPTDVLFYQIIGPFYIFLYSSMAYVSGRELSGKRIGGILSVLLLSLSSNWYYIANLLYPSSYKWPSVAWVDYFSSKSVNYPLLYSIIQFSFVIYLFKIVKKFDAKGIVLMGFLIGSLTAFKSHTGIIMIGVLGVWSILLLFLKVKDYFKIFVLSAIVGLAFIFLTFTPGKQGLILLPFWFIKTMYEAPDRLNFSEWELQRQYLLTLKTTKSYFSVAKLYVQGIALFLLVNIGPLFIGLIALIRNRKKEKKLAYFMALISTLSVLFVMLFVYSGVAIVSIQFFYTAIVALSFLTAMVLTDFIVKRRILGIFVSLVIWGSLLPGVFHTIKSYQYSTDSNISSELTSALIFLSREKSGAVLTEGGYSGTSLISAYSKKSVYYADEIILSSLSIDYDRRKRDVLLFFTCSDAGFMKRLLNENNISYVFTTTQHNCLDKLGIFKRIFKNNEVTIYRV